MSYAQASSNWISSVKFNSEFNGYDIRKDDQLISRNVNQLPDQMRNDEVKESKNSHSLQHNRVHKIGLVMILQNHNHSCCTITIYKGKLQLSEWVGKSSQQAVTYGIGITEEDGHNLNQMKKNQYYLKRFPSIDLLLGCLQHFYNKSLHVPTKCHYKESEWWTIALAKIILQKMH